MCECAKEWRIKQVNSSEKTLAHFSVSPAIRMHLIVLEARAAKTET